jgi:hypothetical protein
MVYKLRSSDTSPVADSRTVDWHKDSLIRRQTIFHNVEGFLMLHSGLVTLYWAGQEDILIFRYLSHARELGCELFLKMLMFMF